MVDPVLKAPLTGAVAIPFGGEATSYKVHQRVRVLRVTGATCTVEDHLGRRCIVGVPLDRIRLDTVSELALELARRDVACSTSGVPS